MSDRDKMSLKDQMIQREKEKSDNQYAIWSLMMIQKQYKVITCSKCGLVGKMVGGDGTATTWKCGKCKTWTTQVPTDPE